MTQNGLERKIGEHEQAIKDLQVDVSEIKQDKDKIHNRISDTRDKIMERMDVITGENRTFTMKVGASVIIGTAALLALLIEIILPTFLK